MENYFAQGQEAFQNALDQGVPPGDAAQQAGDMMSQGLMDAGFPPEMIQAGMEAGMQSFQQGMDGNMPPMDALVRQRIWAWTLVLTCSTTKCRIWMKLA